MERSRERPPAYHHHIPPPLTLPDVPSQLPTAHRRAQSSQITLPDIKSLGLPDVHRTLPPISANQPSFPPLWPSTPRFEPSYSHLPSPLPRPSVEQHHYHAPSTGFDQVMHGEPQYRAPSVMSIDDATMREAAETLSMFKNPESMRSPSTTRSTTVQPLPTDTRSPASSIVTPSNHEEMEDETAESEPLLELLTTSHPWIGGTVNGSLSAYHTALNYSPKFVRSSTKYVERTVGTPLANGIGAVSSRIGLESGVRRYLGERVPSDQDTRPASKRRRQTEEVAPDVPMDIEKGLMSPSIYHYNRSRAGSQASFAEPLPAYDASARSPPYEESMADIRAAEPKTQLALQSRSAAPSRRGSLAYTWGQQLMITTSGLGVALSETSLRQLKLCLDLLSKATANLTAIMKALKDLLADYQGYHQASSADQALSYDQREAAAAIADKIRARGNEIMGTLHQAIDAVSKYAGGALPDNASALVRRQLMSVPQRWRIAAQEANASNSNGSATDIPPSPTSTIASNDDDALRSGTRLVNFAVQGLDMFEQVGLVLSATIKSADKWLESMGRRGSATAGPSRRSSVRPMEKSSFAFVAPQQQQQQQPQQPHGFTAVNDHSNIHSSGSWAHFSQQQQTHQGQVPQQMESIDVVMGE